MTHVITNLAQKGGSQHRAWYLFLELSKHVETKIWSVLKPDLLWPGHEVSLATNEQHPKDGTWLIVGTYWSGRVSWWNEGRPTRIIIVHNTPFPNQLAELLAAFPPWYPKPEMVYASQWVRESAGLPGVIHYSPIDLNLFHPVEKPRGGAFKVGRLSRDVIQKHHPEDPSLYRRLAEQKIQVRVQGGLVLKEQIETVEGIDLLPLDAQTPEVFLAELDCFLYRTSPSFREPSGRVVTEALATGIPVVCHSAVGYTELIQQGVNGFVFDTTEEAFDLVIWLRDHPEEARTMGLAGRRTVERVLGPESLKAMIQDLLGSDGHPVQGQA